VFSFIQDDDDPMDPMKTENVALFYDNNANNMPINWK